MVPVSLTFFLALLLSPNPTFSADPPESSPSPSPQLPPPTAAPSPAFRDSPPAPPPFSRVAPDSPSPAPSPDSGDGASYEHRKARSPAPAAVADQRDHSHLSDLETEDGFGGMSGGRKAGIAVGVIAAGCIVALGALVFKKRQQNIRRAQYGYAARREFL